MPGLNLPKDGINLGVRILAIGNRGSAGILHATTVMPQVTLPDFAHRMEILGVKGKVKVGHQTVLNVVFVVTQLNTLYEIVLQ